MVVVSFNKNVGWAIPICDNLLLPYLTQNWNGIFGLSFEPFPRVFLVPDQTISFAGFESRNNLQEVLFVEFGVVLAHATLQNAQELSYEWWALLSPSRAFHLS